MSRQIQIIRISLLVLALIVGLLMGSVVILFFPEAAYNLLLIIAITLIFFGIKGIVPYYMARRWPTMYGTVSAIQESWQEKSFSASKINKYYYPLIIYEYSINETTYFSSCVSFEVENIWVPETGMWGDIINDVKKFWVHWSDKSKIPIYVDPKNPSKSVIVKNINGQRLAHHLTVIVSGVVCLCLGVFLNFYK